MHTSMLFKTMLANQKEVASWFSMVSQNVITLIVINDPNNSYHGYINQQSTRMKVISLSNLTLFNLNQICYSEFNYTLFYQKLGIRSIKVITFVITHCALKSLCHHTKRAWLCPYWECFTFDLRLLHIHINCSIILDWIWWEKKVGGCIMQIVLCV